MAFGILDNVQLKGYGGVNFADVQTYIVWDDETVDELVFCVPGPEGEAHGDTFDKVVTLLSAKAAERSQTITQVIDGTV